MKIPGLFFLCGCLLLAGCKGGPESAPIPEGSKPIAAKDAKVKITDIVVGKGKPVAAPGDTVWMQYRGTLTNGTEFDSNMGEDKDPYMFVIGQKAVIEGWDKGVVGMKPGGERKLEVPSALGYGPNAQAKIPANSDLVFTVKMLGLMKAGEDNVIDLEDIKKGTGNAVVKPGSTVTIKFKGSLLNGRVFEEGKEPFTFVVGQEKTLSCIDKGVRGMKVGGVRKVIAPPSTAYAGLMNTDVPYNSEVIFQLTVLSIK